MILLLKETCLCDLETRIVYFFLVGGCARIYKILQRNATPLLVSRIE
jgi:hypothetical protein